MLCLPFTRCLSKKKRRGGGGVIYVSPLICPAGGRFRIKYPLNEFVDKPVGTIGICCCKNYGKAVSVRNGLLVNGASGVYVIARVEVDGEKITEGIVSRCKSERQLEAFYSGIADEKTKTIMPDGEVWYPRVKVEEIL